MKINRSHYLALVAAIGGGGVALACSSGSSTGGGGSSFAIATATGVTILQQVPSVWSFGASDGLVVITY